MTFIIYLRCEDGCILISDRLSLTSFGVSREKQKCFVSQKADFFLGGAGDGLKVDHIFTKIDAEGVNGDNVKQRLKEIIFEFHSVYTTIRANIDLILIACENGKPIPYEVKIRQDGTTAINQVTSPHLCIGGESFDHLLAEYLLKKYKYTALPLQVATQFAIAVMKEISERQDSKIGNLRDYGFDIFMFHYNDGYAYSKIRYSRVDSATIKFELELVKEDIYTEYEKHEIGSGESDN